MNIDKITYKVPAGAELKLLDTLQITYRSSLHKLNDLLLRRNEPLTFEATEEKKENPKPAFGLGFSLKKTEPVADSKSGSEESNPYVLICSLPEEQLNINLARWFGWQVNRHKQGLEQNLFLGVGSVKGPKRRVPILYYPILLTPHQGAIPFGVLGYGSDILINEEALDLLQEHDIQIPGIPEMAEDFGPSHFLDDLRSRMVASDQLSIKNEVIALRAEQCQLSVTESNTDEVQSRNGEHISPLRISANDFRNEVAAEEVINHPLCRNTYALELAQLLSRGNNLEITLPETDEASTLIESVIADTLSRQQRVLMVSQHPFAPLLPKLGELLTPHHLALGSIRDRQKLIQTLETIVDPPDRSLTRYKEYESVDGDLLEALTMIKEQNHPICALGLSRIEIEQRLREYSNIPEIELSMDEADAVTPEQLDAWKADIARFVTLDKEHADDHDFSWSDLERYEIDPAVRNDILRLLKRILNFKERLLDICLNINSEMGLPSPPTPADVEKMEAHRDFFESAPELDKDQLDCDWSSTPDGIDAVLELVRKAKYNKQKAEQYFHKGVYQEHLDELIPRLKKDSLSFTRHINWRYKKDIERLFNYVEIDNPSVSDRFWDYLSIALAYKRQRKKLKKEEPLGKRYFASYWKGVKTDLDLIKKQIKWLKECHHYCERHHIEMTPELKAFIAGEQEGSSDDIKKVTQIKEGLLNAVSILKELAPLSDDSKLNRFETLGWREINRMIRNKIADLPNLDTWTEYKTLQEWFDRSDIMRFVEEAREQETNIELLPALLEKCFLQTIVAKKVSNCDNRSPREVNESVRSGVLDHGRAEKSYLSKLRTSLLKQRSQAFEQESEAQKALKKLQHELRKQSRYTPIPYLISSIWPALSLYTPLCSVSKDRLPWLTDALRDFQLVILIDPDQPLLDRLLRTLEPNQQLLILTSSDKPLTLPEHEDRSHLIWQVGWAKTSSGIVPTLQHHHLTFDQQQFPVNTFREGQTPFQIMDLLEDNDSGQAIWFENQKLEDQFWRDYTRQQANQGDAEYPRSFDCFPDTLTPDTNHLPARDHAVVTLLNPADNGIKKPAFGFGLTKSAAPKDIAYDSQQLAVTAKDVLRLIGPDTHANQLKYLSEQLEQVGPTDNEDNEISRFLKEQFEDEYTVKPLNGTAYSALITSDEEFLPDVVVYSDQADLGIYGTFFTAKEIQEAGFEPVYFPATYYPDRLHEWFLYLQKRIKAVTEEQYELARDKAEEQVPESSPKETSPAKETRGQTEDSGPQLSFLETAESEDQLVAEYTPPPGVTFDLVATQQPTEQPDFSKLPELADYTFHEDLVIGTKHDFFEASDQRIQKIILDVVEVESPIHWRNLTRCIAAYWQIQRINEHVESAILRNIQKLKKNGRIFISDGSLYNNKDLNFKLRSRAQSIAFHRADEIPLDECEAALFEVLSHTYPITKKSLLEAAAHYLGFERLDLILSSRLERALLRMADQKVAAKGKNGIQLKPKFYSGLKM